MLIITGEVRKVLDSSYKSKSKDGQLVSQSIVVIEPDDGRQNYEVFLSSRQIKDGALNQWEAIKGHRASVAVNLYVNYQYKFYKFTAAGSGSPLPVRSDRS